MHDLRVADNPDVHYAQAKLGGAGVVRALVDLDDGSPSAARDMEGNL